MALRPFMLFSLENAIRIMLRKILKILDQSGILQVINRGSEPMAFCMVRKVIKIKTRLPENLVELIHITMPIP